MALNALAMDLIVPAQPNIGSAFHIGVAKLFLGIVLTHAGNMICVAREFD
jgi:hypothetical protein